jgi:hypothetical protein
MKQPIKLIKTCSYDYNSVSLFDGSRKNQFNELFCVASGILESEVNFYWQEYLKSL